MIAADELEKAKEGDLKSLEKLCLATWKPLYCFIYCKVQNCEEAEDITQETYVKTLNYLQERQVFRKNFLGFMKTVALNIIRDRWRQKKRRGIALNIEDINPEKMAGMDHQKEVAERLQIDQALTKLSENQRVILDLRIIKGYSVADTAKLVGKTEAAVRTAQYRALQTLAQILDGND
ncbi:RNA polymerase sigma factor [Desulfolucanica intricata]|uniref:RNA polymerase sigma factor n=1 Tax=Desulfolucanica intricata TaxID=1285191 RepID=UPI00083475BD|nr:sigma-70 family RNA polymerase sigma factor [Desulfolucanica intricata]